MTDSKPNAGIERPGSIWGDNPRLRNIVLTVVALLIVARLIMTVKMIEDYWRPAARWAGYHVAPNPDPARKRASLKAADLQAALGDPTNYPQSAMDRGEQGLVIAQLEIADSGWVDGCRVVQSSRSRTLDRATCALVRRRLLFDPARGASGEPIRSTFQLRMRWMLPPDDRIQQWTRTQRRITSG